jgi:hypothetical protein
MMRLLVSLALLISPAVVQAQESVPAVGADLAGTSWLGSANALGTEVFIAMEFPEETPGEVLLTMPNALALRAAFELSGTTEGPTVIVSAGGKRIRLRLEPELDRDSPRISGDMEVLGDDQQTAVQVFPFLLKSWTPPERLESQKVLDGTLTLPGKNELKLILRLGSSGDEASARMGIPAQSVSMYPCRAVLSDDRWRIETNFGTPVVTEIAPDPERGSGAYAGTMEQSGFSMPVLLETVDVSEVDRDRRPQMPKPPFPYVTEEVQIDHPDGHVLAGTLVLPDGAGHAPVVVFITGSGPQDRDESIMGHSPFLVISDYLARNGIASLRYDDRGFGKSTGTYTGATSEDFATDVLAAVAWLRARDDLDTEAIGLLGHSEGGLIAPIAVSKDKEIDFAILLAGTGVDGGRILTSQTERIMETAGNSPEEILAVVAVHEELMDSVRRDAPMAEIRDRYIALSDVQIDISREYLDDDQVEEIRAETREQIGEKGDPLGEWLRAFIKLDPRGYLSQMTCPVLALNGTKDVQVISELNLPEIKRAVTIGGGEVTVIEYEGLNHLFQRAETGAVGEYGEIETTIEPEVLEDIVTWILQTTGNDDS